MPTISVVIPAYNAEKTIQETIDSVLNQTFSDLELIVINDGSQDSTLDLLAAISDPRLKVFSYPNAGLNTSRNRGIHHALGDYISFLDADDLWTPDKLEAQYNALKNYPEASVAYSWTNWIDAQGRFLRRGSYSKLSGHVYQKLLLHDFVESGSNPLIRKSVFDQTGGFDESLVGLRDWDMWARLAEQFAFAVVPIAQVLYRQSPNTLSTNLRGQESGFKQIFKKLLENNPNFSNAFKRQVIANRYICLASDALQEPYSRERGKLAAEFLSIAIRHDPSLLRAKVLVKVIFKMMAMLLLPPTQAKTLIQKSGNFADIKALHGYLRIEVS